MPSVVIGVPGLWKVRTEPILALGKLGYLVSPTGDVVDTNTNERLPLFIDVYDRDPRMRSAFDAVSAGKIDDDTLARIDAHTTTLYVGSNEPHSLEISSLAMRFAGALLDVGGLAVKVETAGVAHSAERWRELLALRVPELAAYHALTVRNAAPDLDAVYSCGMHHLALPDVIVDGASEEHVSFVDLVNKYLALHKPLVKDGHFMQRTPKARYRMKLEECTLFPKGELFHNPFGVWRLTLVDEGKKKRASPSKKRAKPTKKSARSRRG